MTDEKPAEGQPEVDTRPEERPYQTAMLSGMKAPPAEKRASRGDTGVLAAPWRLLVQIGVENPTTVGLEVRDAITIGRADPSRGFVPDLDLTPYGGRSQGVSRRHAVIRQQDQRLFLEDLGSTNGTHLNGGEVQPGQLYRLHDGDQIDVGQTRLLIRFVRAPA